MSGPAGMAGQDNPPSASPPRRARRAGSRLAGYAAGLLLALGAVAIGFGVVSGPKSPGVAKQGDAASSAAEPLGWPRTAVSDAQLADVLGVRVVGVAVTGGGGLIDVRFQVVDPDKAAALHQQATPPGLIDDTTGVLADQLLMGHSHTDAFKAGHTYYLIFENPGNLVQRGGKVSVLLGRYEVVHYTVS